MHCRRYKGVVQKKWYRHYFAILASVFQMCGTIVYVFDEGWAGLTHLPATVGVHVCVLAHRFVCLLCVQCVLQKYKQI